MKYEYLYYIFIPIIFAIIVNAIIFSQKIYNNNDTNKIRSNMLPPNCIIAIVWIIILGLLGDANYIVRNSYASVFITLAIIYCIVYPFLTSNIKISSKIDRYQKLNISNQTYDTIAVILASIVCIMSYIKNNITIYLTLPFLIWTLYIYITLYY